MAIDMDRLFEAAVQAGLRDGKQDKETLDGLDEVIASKESEALRAREAKAKYLTSVAAQRAAASADYFKLPVEERQKLTLSNPEYVKAMWAQRAAEAVEALRQKGA
jgi:hypothetical protein